MTKNRLIVFLVCLTLIGFGWGFFEVHESNESRIAVESLRDKSFYDLMDSVEKLSVLSSKTLISSDSSSTTKLLAELNTEAYVAQENLCQLPLYHNSLLRTEKFLNQMGDFSYCLLKRTSDGGNITEEEFMTLSSLNEEVENISIALHNLEGQSTESPFSWQETRKAAKLVAKNEIDRASMAHTSMAKITSDLDEIPALTYDGPFSDTLENSGPLKLTGAEISWADALAKAEKLLGSEYEYEAYGKSSENAGIAVKTVQVMNKRGETVGYCDFSNSGGYFVQYTADSGNGKRIISAEEGHTIAEDFMAKTEYENMVSSYYIIEQNVLTINFLYYEDSISVYPDLIKVSVDLTTKTVVGFDAKTYLKNHKERNYNQAILPPDEGRAKLKPGLSPLSEQLTIIPLEDGSECLCYEYRLKVGEHEYLLYINAKTGKEENILTLVTSNDGTIAM